METNRGGSRKAGPLLPNRFSAVKRGDTWTVNDGERMLLVNLSPRKAMAIAVILNSDDDAPGLLIGDPY